VNPQRPAIRRDVIDPELAKLADADAGRDHQPDRGRGTRFAAGVR
jgi:hypothetical protein